MSTKENRMDILNPKNFEQKKELLSISSKTENGQKTHPVSILINNKKMSAKDAIFYFINNFNEIHNKKMAMESLFVLKSVIFNIVISSETHVHYGEYLKIDVFEVAIKSGEFKSRQYFGAKYTELFHELKLMEKNILNQMKFYLVPERTIEFNDRSFFDDLCHRFGFISPKKRSSLFFKELIKQREKEGFGTFRLCKFNKSLKNELIYSSRYMSETFIPEFDMIVTRNLKTIEDKDTNDIFIIKIINEQNVVYREIEIFEKNNFNFFVSSMIMSDFFDINADVITPIDGVNAIFKKIQS